VEEYEIGMDAVGVRFRAGHRIRLEVTSSWFPRYDRNTNSGADNPFADATTVVARQAVVHTGARPSHLVLPVVE
jgi:predicted acyl esterase